MDYGDHVAKVFGSGVVCRLDDEVLVWCGGNVAAWDVPLPAFDHHNQPAALAGIFGLGVSHDVGLEAVA